MLNDFYVQKNLIQYVSLSKYSLHQRYDKSFEAVVDNSRK
jgi:hypothetical protein